jgi:hypothetical protein
MAVKLSSDGRIVATRKKAPSEAITSLLIKIVPRGFCLAVTDVSLNLKAFNEDARQIFVGTRSGATPTAILQ